MRKLASTNLCQNLFGIDVVPEDMCSGVEVPYQHSFAEMQVSPLRFATVEMTNLWNGME